MLASAAVAGTTYITSADECRRAYEAADALSTSSLKDRSTGEVRARLIREAGRICRLAAESEKDSEQAAELMSLSYLVRFRGLVRNNGDESSRKLLLREGLDAVSGLHHDRSPALFDLLRKSSLEEADDDHERAVELAEQAVEIARSSFGETDYRVALALSDLGFLFAPHTSPGASPRATTDRTQAELHYRQALEIFAEAEELSAVGDYANAVSGLKDLMVSSRRFEEAESLKTLLDELSMIQEQQQARSTPKQ